MSASKSSKSKNNTQSTPPEPIVILPRDPSRASTALRPITIERQFTKHAPGSVLVSFGDTKVIVTASVEERVPRHVHQSGNENAGWLTAEYSMLPGATNTRGQRDRLKVSGRTAEIQRLIGRSLRAALDLSTLGQRTITIDADVIQADGGTRVAAITGGYVALADALQRLIDDEKLLAMPIRFGIAAVSVGIVGGEVRLDLDYEEDSQAEVDANVVMTHMGEIIEFQATSESKPYSIESLNDMLSLAKDGIAELIEIQRTILASE